MMTTGPLPALTEATIRQYATADVFERGQSYQRRGAVLSLTRRDNVLQGEVEGSEVEPYRVRLDFDAAGITAATCTCPYGETFSTWCEHIVAVALDYVRRPERVAPGPSPDTLLADLDAAQLRTLLRYAMSRDPDLIDLLAGQITLMVTMATPMGSQPGSSPDARGVRPIEPRPRRTLVDVGAVRRQVRTLLQGPERRSRYSGYDDYPSAGAALGPVDEVVAQARAFSVAGDGRGALDILAAVTEEFADSMEYFDDSDGESYTFAEELGRAWAEAILSADLSAAERGSWEQELERLRKKLADYSVDDGLYVALSAARQGWDNLALRRVLRGESTVLDPTIQTDGDDEDDEVYLDEDEDEDAPAFGGGDEDDGDDADDDLRDDDLNGIRLDILERQGRYQEYLNLAIAASQSVRYATMLIRLDRVGEAIAYSLERLGNPGAALTVATALRERGETDGALRVAEQGLTLSDAAHGSAYAAPVGKGQLATWLRDFAAGLGETGRALAAGVIAFEAEPTLAAYLRVAELAGDEWPARRDALLAYLRGRGSFYSYAQGPVDVFLHEGLIDDAIATVDKGATDPVLEQVADAATASRPAWVIEVGRKRAEGIMNAGQAAHYDIAARWLGKARAAYQAAGRAAEWQLYLNGLLATHSRKYKLVPMLKALALR